MTRLTFDMIFDAWRTRNNLSTEECLIAFQGNQLGKETLRRELHARAQKEEVGPVAAPLAGLVDRVLWKLLVFRELQGNTIKRWRFRDGEACSEE